MDKKQYSVTVRLDGVSLEALNHILQVKNAELQRLVPGAPPITVSSFARMKIAQEEKALQIKQSKTSKNGVLRAIAV